MSFLGETLGTAAARDIRGGPALAPERRTRGYLRGTLGRGWQRGQLNDERFMNASRRIGAPQRWQGRPSRP